MCVCGGGGDDGVHVGGSQCENDLRHGVRQLLGLQAGVLHFLKDS